MTKDENDDVTQPFSHSGFVICPCGIRYLQAACGWPTKRRAKATALLALSL